MPYITVLGPKGQELQWSENAHKRVIGSILVVADLEKPRPEDAARKTDFGRQVTWISPDRTCLFSILFCKNRLDETLKAEMHGLLERLHGLGVISDGKYGQLKSALGPAEPKETNSSLFGSEEAEQGEGRPELDANAACREICMLGNMYGYWIRALKNDGESLRAVELSDFDHLRHHLLMIDLARIGDLGDEYAAMGEQDRHTACERHFEAMLNAIEEAPPLYAVSAVKAKKADEGAWKADPAKFRRIAEGMGMDEIGGYMYRLDGDELRQALQ